MDILAQYHLFNDRLPKDTGIYAIANLANKKLYIGSAASVNHRPSKSGFRNRFVDHRKQLKAKTHHAKKLLNAFWADGVNQEDFVVWILEYCPPEKCIEREQWYFDTYKPWYNGLLTAGNNRGYKKTKETIELHSKALSTPITLYYKPEDIYVEMEGIRRFTKENPKFVDTPLYNLTTGKGYSYKGFYLNKEYALDKSKWEADYPLPKCEIPGVMWRREFGKWAVRPTYNKTVYNLGEYENEAEAIEVLLEFRKTHPAVSREVPKSGYKGVSWNSKQLKWKAQPCHSGKQYFLGYFKDKEDAIAAIETFKLTLKS